MVFNINKKMRITGGEEYVIQSTNNGVIVSIHVPAYKIKTIDDLKNEIVKFWDISKDDIIMNELQNIMNSEEEKETRTCSECNKEMTQGYCIENGEEYYCSDECLHNHYTQEEYEEMYDDGNGDSYWTEWED